MSSGDKENFYEYILGSIYWKDKEGFYLGANDFAAKMVGLSSVSELIGKTDYDLFSKDIADQYIENDRYVIEENKTITVEEKSIDANGREIYQLSSKKPLRDNHGNIIGVLGSTVDITYLKKIENELREAKEKAEQANQLQQQFIQNMQHDIRTPLAGIYMFMEQQVTQEEDPEKKMLYQHMAASSGQLLNFCNEIVDFEHIEYLGSEIHYEVVDVRKFFSKPIDLEKATAINRGINLALEVDPNVPLLIKLDKLRVERILINLIGNALKFTDQGEVILKVVALSSNDQEITLKLNVRDTGIGISADKIDLIFDKFVRLNPSNSGIYKGTGLGLFYVKKFVEDLQGKMKVKSEK